MMDRANLPSESDERPERIATEPVATAEAYYLAELLVRGDSASKYRSVEGPRTRLGHWLGSASSMLAR